MKKAVFVKEVDQKLWRTDDGYVATVRAAFDTGHPETMVFKACGNGLISDLSEIGFIDAVSHVAALADAGFVVATELDGE